MSKTKELYTTTALVKEILKQDEKARNSDSFLYFRVLGVIALDKGIDINRIPVPLFLLKMTEWGFPPFESVRRSRQKLQAAFPELSADEDVESFRAENETEFRAFAVADIS
jgi:hypothetical protein